MLDGPSVSHWFRCSKLAAYRIEPKVPVGALFAAAAVSGLLYKVDAKEIRGDPLSGGDPAPGRKREGPQGAGIIVEGAPAGDR
jgi:hypothetical protein